MAKIESKHGNTPLVLLVRDENWPTMP